jgi:hypothetical protein
MIDKTEPELKERIVRYCNYRALGYEPSDAYRRSFKAKRLPAETIHNRAQRLEREQPVIDRIALCVNELKLEQLDSLGKVYRELIDSLAKCKEGKHWAAYFTGMTLRMKC